MIEVICALDKIKKLKDNSQDIIFADPPYALGSTVLIGKDGKPYYKEAKDFMNSWTMPDEKFWEEFYQECMRVLKYGGRVLFFGIDRQLFLFQYYAVASGLEIKQSLYWYFITNFPKSTDLSKQIEKRLGADMPKGELISENIAMGGGITPDQKRGCPETELGKKYDGLKYSISPLKQVLETIMVFQKPTKNKSVLDDVFAYEDGDDEISVSAWNIDGGRVPTNDKWDGKDNLDAKEGNTFKSLDLNSSSSSHDLGRFPSQLLIDEECANRLDEQSGIRTSGARKSSYTRNATNPNGTYGTFGKNQMDDCPASSGGASKILHKIGYLDEELDLLIYDTKVSIWEREFGCDGFEAKEKVFNGISGENSKEMKGGGKKNSPLPQRKTLTQL